jgi:hypothetical protein
MVSTELPLERRLQDLYAVPVPTALDRRVEAAIATVPIRRSNSVRRRTVAVLAVAAVIATSAAGPALEWFQGWDRRYDRLWELSTSIDQSVTEDGYRVTVHRAYADRLGVRLAMSVEDLDDRWSGMYVDGADVTGADGQVYEGWNWSNTRTPADATSATWSRFLLPTEAHERDLHLRVTVTSLAVRSPEPIPRELDPERIWSSVAGAWTFEVDVPITQGHAIQPGVRTTVGGVTVTLEELGMVPSGTVARLAVHGLPAMPVGSDRGWYPTMRVEHDGEPLNDDAFDPGVLAADDQVTVELLPVVGDLAGQWTITIFEFTSFDPARELSIERSGPWVLEFDVPAVP